MYKIDSIIDVAAGGYQNWAETSGYGQTDKVFHNGYYYHLHPPMSCYASLAAELGIPEGTQIAGIRWKESTALNDAEKRTLRQNVRNMYCVCNAVELESALIHHRESNSRGSQETVEFLLELQSELED